MPKDLGGFGLPDMMSFAQAALFKHISDWLMRHSIFSNYDIEEALFSLYSLSALLHIPKRLLPINIYSSLLFTSTYNSRCFIIKRLNRDTAFSSFNTIWGNPCFVPGIENDKFDQWREKDISAVRDIFDPGGNIRSFVQL